MLINLCPVGSKPTHLKPTCLTDLTCLVAFFMLCVWSCEILMNSILILQVEQEIMMSLLLKTGRKRSSSSSLQVGLASFEFCRICSRSVVMIEYCTYFRCATSISIHNNTIICRRCKSVSSPCC